MKCLRYLPYAMIAFCIVYALILIFNFANNCFANEYDIYGIDYADYYSAGKMTVSGDDCYNDKAHAKVLDQVTGRELNKLELNWIYPPTFMLYIAPLSLLPFNLSLIVWIALTLGLMTAAIFKLVPKCKNLAFLAIGFPGLFLNIKWGQNGFLSAAFLAFGIYFIEANPTLSGVMFGLLAYKPQLAVLPIMILVLNKKWRIVLWSCISGAASILISGLIFGCNSWANFTNSLGGSSNHFLQAWETYWQINPSFYSVIRLSGVEGTAAYILLALSSVAVIVLICRIWRATESSALKGSALILGIPFVMPYFLQYDLVILVIPLVLLAYDCFTRGYRLYELVILVLLFVFPLLNQALATSFQIQICPIILAAVLYMITRRVKKFPGRTEAKFT